MSKHSSMSYGTNSLQEAFVDTSTGILRDLKDFIYKHIYLLGYF